MQPFENGNLIIGIVNISSGLLLILMSIPLVAGKVPMNKFYGFRIPKSFESAETWFKINSYGGKQLIFWSILLIVVGISYFFSPIQGDQNEIDRALRTAGPMVICITIAIVKTFIYSKTL
jgi:hypothetical protein